MTRLPKRLKTLRAHLRRVFGRDNYGDAHIYAWRLYKLELEARKRGRP